MLLETLGVNACCQEVPEISDAAVMLGVDDYQAHLSFALLCLDLLQLLELASQPPDLLLVRCGLICNQPTSGSQHRRRHRGVDCGTKTKVKGNATMQGGYT